MVVLINKLLAMLMDLWRGDCENGRDLLGFVGRYRERESERERFEKVIINEN